MFRSKSPRDVEKCARRFLVALIVMAGCGTGTPPPPPPEPVPAIAAPAEPDAPVEPDAAPGPDAAPERDAAPAPDLPMLLDFTRDHCLPCELMAPWLDELRREHAGRVLVREINIDRPENREVGMFFRARAIPTQVYVDAKGREVRRHAGLATKEQMRRTLEQLGFVPKG